MLIKNYQIMFMAGVIYGTILATSSSSWFTCWLGLEINLMSLVPLLINKLNPLSTESAIKYFLAQAMGSMIIIISSMLDSTSLLENTLPTMSNLIFIALMIKGGLAPFHFWFPQVMKMCDWNQCSVLVTWQKVAPFTLLGGLGKSGLIPTAIMFTAIVGMLGGLNQMMFKTILTYSSIAHSAWMLATVTISFNVWMIYFFIYSFIALTIIIELNSSSAEYLHQYDMNVFNSMSKMSMIFMLLSLGGLPPLLGFFAKLSSLQVIMGSTPLLVMVTLIISSVVSLYFYMRCMYSSLMLSASKNKTFLTKKANLSYFFTITVLGNLFSPLLVLLT